MNKYELAAKKIIDGYLKISNNERFFIITDSNSNFPYLLSKACFEIAKSKGIETKMLVQKKIEYGPADKKTIEFLRNLRKGDCLFLCLNGKLGNLYESFKKGFRTYLRVNGVRFATMVGLENMKNEDFVLDLINFDTNKIKSIGERLKKILDEGKEIEIFGKSGTRIKASIEKRRSWFNSGEFWEYGKGGNIPAGDITIPPIEGSVEGVVFADVSVKAGNETLGSKKPIKFVIKDGEIVDISGDDFIKNKIENDLTNFSIINSRQGFDPRAIFRICEIGFGLLPGSPIGVNFIDGKLFGIAGIANGNNYGKGGKNKCRGHRQHLFMLDKIRVDEKTLTLKDLIYKDKELV